MRAFRISGCEVFVADNWPNHFGTASRHVTRNFHVPEANRDPLAYAETLVKIVAQSAITHVIPVNEEVFFLAAAAHLFPPSIRVVVDSSERLRALHDKAEFNRIARGIGLDAPESDRVTSRDELASILHIRKKAEKSFVLKPSFSRFSTRVVFSGTGDFEDRVREIPVSEAEPWIVQDRVRGEEVCSYSVCERGRLLAHVTYSRSFTAGAGAAVSFTAIDNPAVRAWVERFVKAGEITGQVAFDFILDENSGSPFALECNPRATSGVHLFSENFPALTRAFLSPSGISSVATPSPGTAGMTTALAVLLYGPAQVRSIAKAREWLTILFRSRDAIFDRRDLGPYFEQFRILRKLWRDSRQLDRSMIAVSTRDIEWNGAEISLPR
jgi:hypothetical protein